MLRAFRCKSVLRLPAAISRASCFRPRGPLGPARAARWASARVQGESGVWSLGSSVRRSAAGGPWGRAWLPLSQGDWLPWSRGHNGPWGAEVGGSAGAARLHHSGSPPGLSLIRMAGSWIRLGDKLGNGDGAMRVPPGGDLKGAKSKTLILGQRHGHALRELGPSTQDLMLPFPLLSWIQNTPLRNQFPQPKYQNPPIRSRLSPCSSHHPQLLAQLLWISIFQD